MKASRKSSKTEPSPKNPPPWKKLELVCAGIEKQLAQDAEIVHDDRIVGKSGSTRKIDISIRQTIGSYPILIIVDCKRHARKVPRKDVAGFNEQIEDVGAHLGVMISETGFDSGAIAVAAEKQIILRTYKQAEQADWDAIFGTNAWTYFTNVSVDRDSAVIHVGAESVEVPTTKLLFDSDHNQLGSIREIWFDAWRKPEMQKLLGNVEFEISGTDSQIFLEHSETKELLPVDRVHISAVLSAKKYLYNLAFGGGEMISDIATEKTIFFEGFSESIDWKSVLQSNDGIEISTEEFNSDLENATLRFVIPQETEKYIRFVYTKKDTDL